MGNYTKNIFSPNISLKQYRKAKLDLLENQMYIRLTDEQRKHFQSLTTEIQIDNYARAVIANAWG